MHVARILNIHRFYFRNVESLFYICTYIYIDVVYGINYTVILNNKSYG